MYTIPLVEVADVVELSPQRIVQITSAVSVAEKCSLVALRLDMKREKSERSIEVDSSLNLEMHLEMYLEIERKVAASVAYK
jgi:hypothetical protein